jgi:hypothetical protein
MKILGTKKFHTIELLSRVNHTQLQFEGKQWKEINIRRNLFQVPLATYYLVYLG